MTSVYLGDIITNKDDLAYEFFQDHGVKYNDPRDGLGEKFLPGVDILLSYYEYIDYSGDAFVLFKKDGELYEVNGGHCSCFGLEGQWEPEKTSIEALRSRMKDGTLGYDTYYKRSTFRDELTTILDALEASHGNL